MWVQLDLWNLNSLPLSCAECLMDLANSRQLIHLLLRVDKWLNTFSGEQVVFPMEYSLTENKKFRSFHLLMIFASRNLDWSVCLNCDNCCSLATNSSAELTPSTGFQQFSHKRTIFVLKNSHCPAFVKSIIDLLQVPPDESEGWPEKPTSIMRKKSVEHKKTYHCDFRRLGPTQRLPPHACCTLIVPSFKTLSLL